MKLSGVNVSLRELLCEDGRCGKWGGWEVLVWKEWYEEDKELVWVRWEVVSLFEEMVVKCEEVDKLGRVKKRYGE